MKHKLILPILLILLSAAVLVACNPGTTGGEVPGTGTPGVETATEVETITLERQPCFGFCPVYTLTIHGDGQVEYDGLNHVEVTGPQTAAIDPAAVSSAVAIASSHEHPRRYPKPFGQRPNLPDVEFPLAAQQFRYDSL